MENRKDTVPQEWRQWLKTLMKFQDANFTNIHYFSCPWFFFKHSLQLLPHIKESMLLWVLLISLIMLVSIYIRFYCKRQSLIKLWITKFQLTNRNPAYICGIMRYFNTWRNCIILNISKHIHFIKVIPFFKVKHKKSYFLLT